MRSSWLVEHSCPQCGAPVTSPETERILSCPFCRVRLYLSAADCFRYYLTPRTAGGDDLLYAPFWRFRGLAFSCCQYEISYRVVDSSMPAAVEAYLPPTLGLRPQAMKLRMLTPETSGRFIPCTVAFRELIERVDTWRKIARPLARTTLFFQRFIGETLSIVYAPIHYRNATMYDAVLDRPLRKVAPEEYGSLTAGEAPAWGPQFLPTMCPHCGWDLSGDPDSCVLLCGNCSGAWQATGQGFSRVPLGIVAADDESGICYLPFWRISAEITGIPMKSYADLVRYANIPRVMQPAWEQRRVSFWVPAFKIQPKLFLRLLQQVTGLQLDGSLECDAHGKNLLPVTLPAAEAAECIRITLAQMAVDPKRTYPLLAEAQVSTREAQVVFLPFTEGPHELVQCHGGFSINKTALSMGRKL